jgi:FKBP-type peptidyl-prolyl cis-trans isomerase (trigger factor)
MKKEYTILDTKKLPHSEIEISGEITVDALATHRPHVLEHMKDHIDLPGFRKGKVPESMLVSKLGELAILEETAQHILEEITPNILADAKAMYIDRPAITITTLEEGKPVAFTIKVPVMPEIKAPAYKKIAKEIMSAKDEAVVVSPEDLNKVIEEIRSRFADSITEAGKEKVLPEINDEFIKKLGEFKDVADFREKVKENIKLERESRNKEKKRIAIAEKLVEEAKLDVPTMFIEQELAVMQAKFKDDIARMGIKFGDYLKHINKTEEDIRKDWSTDAVKKVSLELLFGEIAREEKITPDEAVLNKEVEHLIEHYPGADKERVTAYVTKQLIADKVFSFLETQ